MNRSASRTSLVNIADARPCGTSLCSAIASSKLAVARARTGSGANVSVRTIVGLVGHRDDRRPRRSSASGASSASTRSPPVTACRPAGAAVERALHRARRRRRRSAGRPACRRPADRRSAAARTPWRSRSTSSSRTESWTISRRRLVQRWPAVPAAANTMPRTARSRSAEGATMAALLPPSSRISRPKRSATTRRHGPAHRASSRWPTRSARPGRRPAPRRRRRRRCSTWLSAVGHAADVGGAAAQQGVHGQRGQRRLVRRLPDAPGRRRPGRAWRSTPTRRRGS